MKHQREAYSLETPFGTVSIVPHPTKEGVLLKLGNEVIAFYSSSFDAAKDLHSQITDPDSHVFIGYDQVDERFFDWSQFPDFSFPEDLSGWKKRH